MAYQVKLAFHLLVLFMLTSGACQAQNGYGYTVTTRPQVCGPGTASLGIAGQEAGDKVTIEWSGGTRNFLTVNDLESGNHWVRVEVQGRRDSTEFTSDTTLYFRIEKEQCPVVVPKHFSPNDDGYNDELRMYHIENYPNFELLIFNKWGQQVHRQRREYQPWRGEWNGMKLPDGTYYYVLTYDMNEKENVQKGDITILR